MKVLIVLIWLSVPLSAYLLLRQDRLQFADASRHQRADCLGRAELLRRYSVALNVQARRVEAIVDPQTRQDWQGSWRDTLQRLEEEQRRLRTSAPSHYPVTDAELAALEVLLKEQQEAVEDAALRRDMWLKTSGGMLDLARSIANAQMAAYYYQSMGAQGIYLLIMEDLAQLEDQFDRRQRELNRLATEVDSGLATGRARMQEIVRRLDELPDVMAKDERVTYPADLAQRARDFNLRRELRRLLDSIGGAPAAQAQPAATPPAGRRSTPRSAAPLH